MLGNPAKQGNEYVIQPLHPHDKWGGISSTTAIPNDRSHVPPISPNQRLQLANTLIPTMMPRTIKHTYPFTR